MRLYPVEFIDSRWFEEFESKINGLLDFNKREIEGKIESNNLVMMDKIDDLAKEINYRIDVENKNLSAELDVLEVRYKAISDRLFEKEKEIEILNYKCENLDRAFKSIIEHEKKHNLTLWEKIKRWVKREYSNKR
jgi:hypothetical protein